MIPHEKEMVKELSDQPFALLGINSDGDRSAVNKILTEQGITWRQAVQGSTSGALAKRYNVSAWPTIYVLDKKGNIRFRDLRGQQLEDAVKKLIAE